jgi:hypothetical protein
MQQSRSQQQSQLRQQLARGGDAALDTTRAVAEMLLLVRP